jgi:hypothetical protein
MEIRIFEKQLKEVEVVKELYTQCDKCGKKVFDSTSGGYDAFDFDLVIKTGSAYPEGGSGEKVKLDLCKNCIDDFMSLLESNGYKLNKSEWDY